MSFGNNMSNSLLYWLRFAQGSPGDIRPQLFTANMSASCQLNRWAMLSGHSPTTNPVIYDLRNYANGFSQGALRSDNIDGSLKCVHGHDNKHVFNSRQHVVFL